MAKLMQKTFRAILVIAALFIAPMTALAQSGLTVEVTVVDDIGPVAGASVIVEGTTNGSVTDIDGVAVVRNVPKDGTLVVSFIGYNTENVKVNNRTKINVTMSVSTEFIDESVVVGYGVQKKESLTSAISQISAQDIENTKQIDVVSSLQGKIPGLLVTQGNSRPGEFGSTFSLRGYSGAPMIVVDGVVRSGGKRYQNWWRGTQMVDDMSALQELDPEDIETISVLKDASAAIYGLGASNGVILITTKKGKVQKPTISLSANVTLQQPVTVRQRIPWTEFLRWDNGMRDVSKLGHRWSEETIKAYENGDPNAVYFDWYNEFCKKVSVAQQYNANIRGGSETVQYYFGLGYAKDDSIFKTNAYNYDRYNLNGNITAKMGQSFTVNFQTTMRITNTKQPGSYNDLGNVSYYAYQSDPTTKPWVASGSGHLTSVAEHKNIAAILDPQYELTDRRNMNFNNTLDLTYDAPFLKGFKIQATGAFDYGMSKSSVTLRHWDEYDYKTDTFVAHGAGNGMNFKQVDQYYEDWMYNTRIYGRIQANYQTKVNQHDIQAMIAAETTVNKRNSVTGYRAYGSSMDDAFFTHPVLSQGDATTQTNTGTRTSNATVGYLARLNYNYGGRYFAEVMARVDGTYNYAPGKRWGVFPSYSLGWRISEENFVKNNAPWLNNLKIRWSDGWTGQVQGAAYAYLLGYTTSGSWSFANGGNTTGYANSSNAETLLSWSKARMMDAGIDWELWRGKFGGSFDWFSRNISGIAAKRSASLPDFYGVSLPSENLDKSQNMGLELMLYHRNTVGEFSYRIQATATFARSRTTYSESAKTAKYTSAYNKWAKDAVGRWSGYNSGSIYHTNGQFANLNQIADANIMYNRTTGNYTLSPGQYSVVDRNGNGYWDSSDVYYVFNNESNPPLQYGLQFSGNWRKFDFSLVFSGSALRWKQVSMSGYAGTGFFYYMPKAFTDSYHVANYGDDPWDPNTQWVSGYYPALQAATVVGSANTGVYNSALPYNYINAAFMRLKTLDFGYTISSRGMAAAGIKGLRVSFNATNLFTICDKRLKYVDPETQDNGENGGTLPPNKGYTFGVRLTF